MTDRLKEIQSRLDAANEWDSLDNTPLMPYSKASRLGGILRCHVCKREAPLQEAWTACYLSSGWPKCHGRTMEWLTAKQLQGEHHEQ